MMVNFTDSASPLFAALEKFQAGDLASMKSQRCEGLAAEAEKAHCTPRNALLRIKRSQEVLACYNHVQELLPNMATAISLCPTLRDQSGRTA